jgi:3-hydroxyacyl-[acyl-carrier-protein] dehydratase
VRFLLYDRITLAVPGERVEAVKCVSLTEEFLREHFSRRPSMPSALVLESMIQALAGLVMLTHDFRVLPFLSLIEDVSVSPDVRPGRRLDLVGTLQSTNPIGSLGHTSASVDGVVVATAGRVVFGQLPSPDPARLKARFQEMGVLP